MLKFFGSWRGAALFTVAAVALPSLLLAIFLNQAGPSWTVAQRANMIDTLTDTPVVLLVVYWAWFLTRLSKQKKALKTSSTI